jgi:hypothetical protein
MSGAHLAERAEWSSVLRCNGGFQPALVWAPSKKGRK